MATKNKNLSVYDKATIPNAKDFRFGIVVSEWNPKITEGLFQGTFDAILDCGGLKENIVLRPLGNIIYFFLPLCVKKREIELILDRTFRVITGIPY